MVGHGRLRNVNLCRTLRRIASTRKRQWTSWALWSVTNYAGPSASSNYPWALTRDLAHGIGQGNTDRKELDPPPFVHQRNLVRQKHTTETIQFSSGPLCKTLGMSPYQTCKNRDNMSMRLTEPIEINM